MNILNSISNLHISAPLKIKLCFFQQVKYKCLNIVFSISLITSSAIYGQNINSGLIGYWQFENNYFNSSLNSINAIAHGNPQFILEPSDCGTYVLGFDGAGDFLTIPPMPSYALGTDSFTIAMRIKYSQEQPYQSPVGYSSLFDKSDTTVCSGSPNGIKILLDYEPNGSEGRVQGRTTVNNKINSDGTPNLRDGLWHCVVYTRTPDANGTTCTLRLYIDGFPEATTTQVPLDNISNITSIYIGANACDTTTENYLGRMDDLRIYERALTAAEVLTLCTCTSVVVGTGDPCNAGFEIEESYCLSDSISLITQYTSAGSSNLWQFFSADANCNTTSGVIFSTTLDNPVLELNSLPLVPGQCYKIKHTVTHGLVSCDSSYCFCIWPSPTISVTTYHAICNGASGGFELQPAGGTPDYNVLVTGISPTIVSGTHFFTSSTLPSISPYPAGNYKITVYDTNNCRDSIYSTITEPPPLTITATAIDAICPDSCSLKGGSIVAHGNGGTPFSTSGVSYYLFTFNYGPNSNLPCSLYSSASYPAQLPGGPLGFGHVGLPSGTYEITVTDANGCTASTTVTFTAPNRPPVNFTLPDTLCRTTLSLIPLYPSTLDGTFSSTVCPGCLGPGNTFNPANAPAATTHFRYADNYIQIPVTFTDAFGCRSVTKYIKVYNCTRGTGGTDCAICPYNYSPSNDIIVNGDFEILPFYGFTSQLNWNPINLRYQNRWALTTNAANLIPNKPYIFKNVLSHTLPFLSDFMVVNATRDKIFVKKDGGEKFVWKQPLKVEKDVVYKMCFRLNTSIKKNWSNKPSIRVRFGDQSVLELYHENTEYNGRGPSDNWDLYTCEWKSSITGIVNAKILFFDLSHQAKDNVFALDDIHVYPCVSNVKITGGGNIVRRSDNSGHLVIGQSGTLTANIPNATSGLVYLWQPGGQTTSSINVSPGSTTNYTVLVSDSTGFVGTETYTLFVSNISSTTNHVSCHGNADGSISVAPQFGSPPYQYVWSNGSTTSSVTGLSAGTYYLTVSDINSSMVSDSFIVTEPQQLIISATTDNPCNGKPNGTIGINSIAGGSYPYQIVWNTSDTLYELENIFAGTYTVMITDSNGCSGNASYQLINENCIYPDCDSTNAYGYVYFNDFDTCTAVISDLNLTGSCGDGSYFLASNATDKCVALDSVNDKSLYSSRFLIVEGAGTTSGQTIWRDSIYGIAGVSYVFEALIYANLDSLRNFPVLDFLVNNTISFSADSTLFNRGKWDQAAFVYTPLSTGMMHFSIVQSNTSGAYGIDDIRISTCKPITLPTTSAGNFTLCAGTLLDSITISVSGDFPPFEVYWDDDEYGTKRYSLTPGIYPYAVVDNIGGLVYDTLIINEWPAINITETIVPVSCNGLNDGSILLNITGGNPPYSIVWSNGNTTLFNGGLSAGVFSVLITDANGCSAQQNYTVSEPAALILGPVTGNPVSLCSGAGGSGTYSVVPVSGVTSYFWTTPAGLTITSGQGTNSINVQWNAGAINNGIKGNVCAIIYSPCGTATTSCLIIDLHVTIPVTPPSISGPSKVCPGDLVSYSISAVARASSYNWSLPTGMTITNGGGSNVITATVLPGYTGGALSVSAVNVCGASPIRTKALLQNIPSTPGTISGPLSGVCGATGITYSILPVINATAYQWTIANGINPGPLHSTSVTFDWNNADTICNISVVAINNCGTSGIRSALIQGKPATPGPISGNPSVCTNGIYPYAVATVAGSLNYNWITPGGTSIISGQSTKAITLGYGGVPAVSQSISVRTSNSCGTSASRQLNGISINICPRYGESSFIPVGVVSLDAYPNPTNDLLNILFSPEENVSYSLRLLDITGKVVYSETGIGNGELKHSIWHTNSYAGGIYMLQLLTEKSMSRVSIVKE